MHAEYCPLAVLTWGNWDGVKEARTFLVQAPVGVRVGCLGLLDESLFAAKR